MATIAAMFNKFVYVFLLFIHLGCFFISTTRTVTSDHHSQNPSSRKRKVSSSSDPSLPKRKTHKALRSSWSIVKLFFTLKSQKTIDDDSEKIHSTATGSSTSTKSSQQALALLMQPETQSPEPQRKLHGPSPESDVSSDDTFFPLRNDIFPCTVCGEIFLTSQSLEQHQSVRHAVSELIDGDTGNNIVRIIFKTGWTDTPKNYKIVRILKIRNSPKILSKFEEYREAVKAKAALKGRDERCIADGNELLRFHCSTFLCDLGLNGQSSICSQQYCNICGIIKSGFSTKLDGISTLSSSWRAHLFLPEEIEQEFKFMNAKRATLVCRVIAGRIGFDSDEVDKEDGGYDSLMSRSISGVHTRLDEEDLLVFNPRAVLPCFVIVYNTV